MYLVTSNKYECCGCTACEQICPSNCLQMVADEEGFLYPKKKEEDKCTHCGLCEKVCPFNNNDIINNDNPSCYYGWHKNNEIRMESTSGAAFVAICEACKELEYDYFSGAIYDDNNAVKHILTCNIEDITKIKRSKYVQSTLGDTFRTIKKLLNDGHKIVFSGTPCQAEGLQKMVGQHNRENLLTIGLVCHGVSSPLCFSKYIAETEKRNGKKLREVRFRDKIIYNGKLNHTFTTLSFKDGSNINMAENPYTITYGLGLMHRYSCNKCPFATPIRDIDITIGDFWGIENYYPELKDEISKGVSLILAHTKKGIDLMSVLDSKMHIRQVKTYRYAVCDRQQQLKKPFSINPKREEFMKKVRKGRSITDMGNRIIFQRKVSGRLRNIAKRILFRNN